MLTIGKQILSFLNYTINNSVMPLITTDSSLQLGLQEDIISKYGAHFLVGVGIVVGGYALWWLFSSYPTAAEVAAGKCNFDPEALLRQNEKILSKISKVQGNGYSTNPLTAQDFIEENGGEAVRLTNDISQYATRIIQDSCINTKGLTPESILELLNSNTFYEGYKHLFVEHNTTIANGCIAYSGDILNYEYIMNHSVLFLNDISGSLLIPYILILYDYVGPEAYLLKDFPSCFGENPHLNKSLFEFQETFFLRELLLYYPELRRLEWLNALVESRLADPDFQESLYGVELIKKLEGRIAELAGLAQPYSRIHLPSLISGSESMSEAEYYARAFRFVLQSRSQSFSFLQWLKTTNFCRIFFNKTYIREAKQKDILDDITLECF